MKGPFSYDGFSGHYRIQSTSLLILSIGLPYVLSDSDFFRKFEDK